MKQLIIEALSFLSKITSTTPERERRRNLRAFKKHRRKIYRDFKKDGLTEEETTLLKGLDAAYVKMLLELNKF